MRPQWDIRKVMELRRQLHDLLEANDLVGADELLLGKLAAHENAGQPDRGTVVSYAGGTCKFCGQSVSAYSAHHCKPAAAPGPREQAAQLAGEEFVRAMEYLQSHGYADWDGSANGQTITLTGCANMMREYAAARVSGEERRCDKPSLTTPCVLEQGHLGNCEYGMALSSSEAALREALVELCGRWLHKGRSEGSWVLAYRTACEHHVEQVRAALANSQLVRGAGADAPTAASEHSCGSDAMVDKDEREARNDARDRGRQ